MVSNLFNIYYITTYISFVANMNKCNTFSSFPPVATKTLRSISSVVHHHALGHNISSSGHHTIHFIRESYL